MCKVTRVFVSGPPPRGWTSSQDGLGNIAYEGQHDVRRSAQCINDGSNAIHVYENLCGGL
jgi:hypothetical protein